MASRNLTAKQQRFVDEYAVDLNATQAAIRAGYSKKTAGQMGAENLKKPVIAAALYLRLSERRRETELSETWVLERLQEIAERCLQHRPVLDKKGRPIYVDTPSGELAPAFTFDSSGANRSVELIGRHFATFTDRILHAGQFMVTKIQRTIVDPKPIPKRKKRRKRT